MRGRLSFLAIAFTGMTPGLARDAGRDCGREGPVSLDADGDGYG